MNFRDQGIIIAKNAIKENTYVVTAFTENHGLYSGVMKQYGKKNGDMLGESNLVDFFWNARLHEHLGNAKCELIKSYNSFIIRDKLKLYAFNSIVALIKKAFCERQAHSTFFFNLLSYLDFLKNEKFSTLEYIKLELGLLTEAGYHLSLNSCAVTGKKKNLHYLSPKSGHSVSSEAAIGYETKLLVLPQFLLAQPNQSKIEPSKTEIKQAFALTSYFFNRYILHNKDLKERQKLIDHLSA